MKDLIRTLLGIRKKRQPLPASSRPPVGVSIVRRGVKMNVTHPIDAELWDWLLLSGWRVNLMRNDRRRRVALRSNALSDLIAAGSEKRAKVHAQLIHEVASDK